MIAANRMGKLRAFLVPRMSDTELALVDRAYRFAERSHVGQVRRSGDPYITHCVEVAIIVADVKPTAEMICAALLHDVMEDTDTTTAELASEFGSDIAGLVGRLAALRTPSESDRRVYVLKLADRLHNARTWQWVPLNKAAHRALETLTVLAPLAERIGMATVGAELAVLSRAKLHEAERAYAAAVSRRIVGLLPPAERPRYAMEWAADLAWAGSRRERGALRIGMAFAAIGIRMQADR
jgi:(p)ppGpp synthase/HD superfamily hydrolase